ncbi:MULTISPECIES: hypothetical protein [unclassified Streptomyces]|uniref:hypothetical protein n=1 Tax=unclassified Streptomyces TaxID=2593676 RepID=UPI0033E2C284
MPRRGGPDGGVDGALTVVARPCCFCHAAHRTGSDAVAGIPAGTVAATFAHAGAGRLFTAGGALCRAGAHAGTIAVLVMCDVFCGGTTHGCCRWRGGPRGVPVLRRPPVLRPRGVVTGLGFAVGMGLLTVAAPTRDAPAGLTNL